MCGLIGYAGKKEALPILLNGLKHLEYRGYDSAGIFMTDGKTHFLSKTVGKIKNLEEKIRKSSKKQDDLNANTGIGHTRWATHGEPTEANAHPHFDCKKEIFVVHNGIIENYKELREKLSQKGHEFESETDTEVIPHLIEEFKGKGESFEEAVRSTLKLLKGAYGLAIISASEPEKIIAAREGSPLIIGLGKEEKFVASDATAILPYTREVIYLDDGEVATLSALDLKIVDMNNEIKEKTANFIDWKIDDSSKAGFDHFMLKEIFEQPEAVLNSIRGRLIEEEGVAKLGGLESAADKIRNLEKIIIVACGSSYNAGLIGKYMIEEYAGVPVEVEYASEFRYRKPILNNKTAIIGISQSGETADTLSAIKEAKQKGAMTLGIVNVVGSSIARETDAGIYNHIGPEISVATTKAFVSQSVILALITMFLGRQRQMSLVTGQRIAKELKALPEKMKKILKQNDNIKKIAQKFKKFDNALFIGRKYNYPIALEGSLKLKEISYIHAEGYGAGEMKHGPLALIDENFPTIAIALKDSVYEKMLSNLHEIKARRGKIIAIATDGDKNIRKIADEVIYIPKSLEMLSPILSVIPLQLFAYHSGIAKKIDVDKPRNLAKSVTVE